MILERLRVKNFRQYYGEQTIEFASGNRNVTVINGNNGAGKTNLFSAINWCLYGTFGGATNFGEIINKRALLDSKVFKPEAEVELKFRHTDADDESTSYVAFRSTHEPGELRLSRITRKGVEEIKNPTLVLNTILPSNVRTYFFFDGEKIDDFAKLEHESQVKDAVYSVLQLQVLERGQQHLSAIGDEYERDLKKMDHDEALSRAIDLRQNKTEEKKQAEIEMEGSRKELHSAQLVIRAVEVELLKQLDIKTDVQRRKECEKHKEDIEQELDEIAKEMQALGTSAYFIVGRDAVLKAISIIDEKRNRGEIPSGIREQFIRDLLERLTCICGRPLPSDSKEAELLKGLIAHSLPSNLENRLLETGGQLRAIETKISSALRAITVQKKRKAKLDDDLNQVIRQSDEISQRLLNKGIQEVEILESKRQSAQKKAADLLISIGRHEQTIKTLEKDIRDLDEELKKVKGLQGQAKLTQGKLALSREAAQAITEVYELFGKIMREKIEQGVQDIFSKLVWKSSQFTKVELSDDFHLSVFDRWGAPARPELSAGERQLLSLSFIVALSRANGSDSTAPMVMDTPFGRLDTIPRENICRQLPTLVDQFVLFVTGEELHGEARGILAPKIGKEYRLDWDKSNGCTEIVEEQAGRAQGA